jgi:hypothetical protein
MEIKLWRFLRKRKALLSLTLLLIVVSLSYLLLTGTVKFRTEEDNLDEVVLNFNELDEDEEIKIFGEFDENEVRNHLLLR